MAKSPTVRLRLALVSPLLGLVALGSAGAQGPTTQPTASASAWGVQVALPNAAPITTTAVSAPPDAAPAAGGLYAYPADGSVVTVQSTTQNGTQTTQSTGGGQPHNNLQPYLAMTTCIALVGIFPSRN